MYKTVINTLAFTLGFLAVVVLGFVGTRTLGGNLATDVPVTAETYRQYEFFASSTVPTIVATTTTATSTNVAATFDSLGRLDTGGVSIAGAEEVLITFIRANHSAGSSVFRVQVAPNDNPSETDWMDFNALQLVNVATSTSNVFLVDRVTLAANATTTYKMDTTTFRSLRCIVVEGTDGSHRCFANIRY